GEPALLALVGARALALLLSGRLAAGAAPRLDRAGGVAAVLGTALALGLGHGLETLAPGSQQRLDRGWHQQLDAGRPARERGLGRRRDELAASDRVMTAHRRQDLGRGDRTVVLDV